MLRDILWLVLGNSGAGKDTTAGILYGICRAVNVKWSRKMKDFVEECYDLPNGYLDDREKRLQLAPCGTQTYLDVMVKLYHAWDIVDPALTARPTAQFIESLLEEGNDVVLTDTRKKCEVDLALQVAEQTGAVVVTIELQREGSKELSSDKLLKTSLNTLQEDSDFYFVVDNNDTYDQLEKRINRVYDIVQYNLIYEIDKYSPEYV